MFLVNVTSRRRITISRSINFLDLPRDTRKCFWFFSTSKRNSLPKLFFFFTFFCLVRRESLPLSPTLQLDVTISSSDCDSESDQQPIRPEKPSKKRRQRTTFSAQEVWAMERAYKRCRYLTVEDEVDLVQRFRIPVKSIKVRERSETKSPSKKLVKWLFEYNVCSNILRVLQLVTSLVTGLLRIYIVPW